MKKLFIYNIKLFFKTKYLSISYLLFLIFSNIYLIRELQWINTTQILYYLRISQKLGIMGFIFFAFITFEYMMLTEKSGLKETISVINKGKFNIYIRQLLFIIIPVFIYSLIILSYNIGVCFYTINYMPYFIHIVKNIVLNVFLVAVIGSLVGAIVALRFKRFAAYGILTLVIFIVSPFFENVVFSLYRITENSVNPINIYHYWDVFKIFAPDLDWVCDNVYGIPLELSRWNLSLFWIFILSPVFLFIISNKKNNKVRIVCILLSVIAIINFTYYLQPNNIMRKDFRPNGMMYGDELYERAIKHEEIKADFNVIAYDMVFDIDRELKAEVFVTLETSSNIRVYNFTLYRGYRISEIVDNYGNPIEYIRDGNYFDIIGNFETGTTEINIKYAGNGNKYYSNNQGIALLGYFPYYPMAGRLLLWDKNTSTINVNTDFTQKKFNIKIKSQLKIVSNLNKSGNSFSGISSTVTLIGGFVVDEIFRNIEYTDSPIGRMNIENLNGLNKYWNNLKELIGETRDVSFENKKIMFTPSTICAASGSYNEASVFLEDHILTMYDNVELLCMNQLNALIPFTERKKNLEELFIDYIKGSGFIYHECNPIMPSYEKLLPLKNEDIQDGDDYILFMEARKELGNAMLAKADELGREYIVKEIYKYLLDENNDAHEVDFIFNLK